MKVLVYALFVCLFGILLIESIFLNLAMLGVIFFYENQEHKEGHKPRLLQSKMP